MKNKVILISALIIFMMPALIACNKKIGSEEGVYYTCPMHPQIKKDAPGQCPICGMDLVKKEK